MDSLTIELIFWVWLSGFVITSCVLHFWDRDPSDSDVASLLWFILLAVIWPLTWISVLCRVAMFIVRDWFMLR